MISESVRLWRERMKKRGYCQFCWKRKRKEGSTITLCATCRRHKIKYEENRRRAKGIKARGKPLPKPYGVLPYRPRKREDHRALEFINAAHEREAIAKLNREEERRGEVRSAWLRDHGYEVRA